MRTTRRCVAACFLWVGFVAWAAMPASAQVDVRYTGPGVVVPTINTPGGGIGAPGGPAGGVLAESGQRTVAPVSEAIPTQVLPSQVSGAVAGTAQAPVQGLAFTGADIVALVTIGLLTLTLGVVLTRRSRPDSVPKA